MIVDSLEIIKKIKIYKFSTRLKIEQSIKLDKKNIQQYQLLTFNN